MNNLIGQNLGRYHIVEALGQGGMASVFKGYDTSLERNVAVKIIRTDIDGGEDAQFLTRFKREAKALAQLDHPFILKVLDYGEQDGVPYLVMPFVPGGTLKEKMGHPMPYQDAAKLLAPVARALEYAHAQKIIHRDVKPANILISQSGAPLLSDFGIAKMLTATGSTQLTATGVGIGTPDYMAPEQWAGESDPRTDVYALGVVFYEMVTGRRPFTADTPAAVLVKHLRDPLPRPRSFIPDLPDSVEQVLFKALDKERENRFQDMGAFATALEQLSRGEETVLSVSAGDLKTIQTPIAAPTELHTSPKPSVTTPPQRKTDTKKIGLFALGAVVVLIVLCVVAGGAIWATVSQMTNKAETEVPAVLASEEPATQPAQEQTTLEQSTQVPQFAFPTEGELALTPFTSIEGYPDDVPLLTDNNGDLSTTVSQGMNMFTFTTNLPFDEAATFYKTGMVENGWQLTTEQTEGGQKLWYFLKGESRMVMVSVMDEEGATRIMIMLVSE